jgi:uncharacterized membrane protein
LAHSFFSKSRVETFSDGVFAIIVTLLVLEIQVPKISNPNSVKELVNALIALLPKFLSWITSFFMVCVIWVNHHRIFEMLSQITPKVFWLNAYLLLWCSFIPFPTAMVGNYIQNPVALSFFGIVLAFVGSGFIMLRYAILKHKLSIDPLNEVVFKKATTKAVLFGISSYLIGAVVSWISTYISLLIFLLIPLYFIFFSTSNKNFSNKK